MVVMRRPAGARGRIGSMPPRWKTRSRLAGELVIAADLQRLLMRIYSAAGLGREDADIVSDHQVEADLHGHASHGAAMTGWYVASIRRGDIVSGAALELVQETPGTAVLDANFGPGQVATLRAVPIAISKARNVGIGAVVIRRQGHAGRLGHYSSRIADAGMIGIVTADSGQGPKSVAPLGGRAARLGTNPISIAVPSADHGSVVLDMSTSAASGGKVLLAHRRGQPLPVGWLLGPEGNQSTDPQDFLDGGALLPLGADQAHKGYGLSFMVEVLSSLLPDIGFEPAAGHRHNDGVFMEALDVSRFRKAQDFARDVSDFIQYLKATPLADGYTEILFPGEAGQRAARQGLQHGVSLDHATRDALDELTAELGVTDSAPADGLPA